MFEAIQATIAGIVVAAFVAMVLFIIIGLIRFAIMDIIDIPKRRATKEMNARVDAIKHANRLKVNKRLNELYGTPLMKG